MDLLFGWPVADVIGRTTLELGLWRHPEQRALLLGEYIVEHGATVRAAARAFGCSKSTVHKDVSVRLRTVGPELFRQVQMVLARNKAERHLRGGAATREKYHKPH